MSEVETLAVFKYLIPFETHTSIKIPPASRILHIGHQVDKLYAWCLVYQDMLEATELVELLIVGTGDVFEQRSGYFYEHISTVQLTSIKKNQEVYHIFKKTELPF